MLFHLGTLWRLNELGLLPQLDRVSSVSGGSIVSAYLALKWDELNFDTGGTSQGFEQAVVGPIRDLASKTVIDVGSGLKAVVLPGSVSDKVAKGYKKHLFGDATLQDITDYPRFVINATNVQSGVLWRFMKPYMRDYRVGEIKNPETSLALAVAASSAFPPFLSPARLKLDPAKYSAPDSAKEDLHFEPFTTDVYLTDGGVYDNLGLETVYKRYRTVLVSDGGGQTEAQAEPHSDWPRHTYRVLNIIDNQVRARRKIELIRSYIEGKSARARLGDRAEEDPSWRDGAYWGIRSNYSDYSVDEPLDCPHSATMELAKVPTGLEKLDSRLQERLINWGFAVSDAALRKHFDPGFPVPGGFPYPGGVK